MRHACNFVARAGGAGCSRVTAVRHPRGNRGVTGSPPPRATISMQLTSLSSRPPSPHSAGNGAPCSAGPECRRGGTGSRAKRKGRRDRTRRSPCSRPTTPRRSSCEGTRGSIQQAAGDESVGIASHSCWICVVVSLLQKTHLTTACAGRGAYFAVPRIQGQRGAYRLPGIAEALGRRGRLGRHDDLLLHDRLHHHLSGGLHHDLRLCHDGNRGRGHGHRSRRDGNGGRGDGRRSRNHRHGRRGNLRHE